MHVRVFGLLLWVMTALAAGVVVVASVHWTRDLPLIVAFVLTLLALFLVLVLGAVLYAGTWLED